MVIMHSSSGSDLQTSSADSISAGHDNINMGTDVYSTDFTSSSTYTFTPNDSSDHSMRGHEITTYGNMRSSSYSGAAAIASMEEGQGESRCDQHVRTSSNSRTRDGERPCNMDMGRRGGKYLCSVNRDHASSFCKDIEQEQEYFQQILGSSSLGWTDEKHSCYLDSMEAEFLRNVMFRGNVHEEATSSELTDSASSQQAAIKSFKEFKVCQNGRWRLMGTGVQPSYVAGPVAQIAVAVKNPWIKRFRPSSKHRVTLLASIK